MQNELLESNKILKTKKCFTPTIVLGNSSCDLDSAVCPVVYAFFLRWQHSKLRDRVCTRQHRTPDQGCRQIFVPILNVSREDYELKTEVAYWFGEHNLKKECLLFRDDDIDLKELASLEGAKLILVDHHILAEDDAFLQPYVTEIIDHRPKDNKHWHYGEQVRSDIQLVGSCASLVCDRIRSTEEGDTFFKTYPECAKLLYGAIILDTVNFSKDIDKGTPTDFDQVLYLERLLDVQDPMAYRKDTLSHLREARSDVSGLTAEQLLRKDVKSCGDILVPSFPILVKEVLTLNDSAGALQTACDRARCTAVVLLGVRLSEPPLRDLAVWCPSDDRREEICRALQEWSEPPLQLSTRPGHVPDCTYFAQGNLAASRKQVMPAVVDFLTRENVV